jgi:O-antigen ligase
VALSEVRVVGVVHAPSIVYAAVAVAAAAAIGWVWRRVGATVDAASAAAFGLGAAATAVGLAGASLEEALASGFAQTHVATTHPNVTGAVALALGAASTLAARRGGALGVLVAVVGVAAALGVVVLTGSRGTGVGVVLGVAALGVVALARWLGRRRPLAATVLALGGPLVLLVAFQAVAFSPTRADAWWPRTVTVVADALGVDDSTPLGQRMLQLQNPMGATGGRLINWRVTRELIAVRPFLGFGFDAVHTVYRNEALFRTSTPLHHPHHGPLTMALQGGSLLLVAVAALVLAVGWGLAGAAVRGDWVAAVVLAFGVGVVGADLLDLVMVQGVVAGPLGVAALGVLGSGRADLDPKPWTVARPCLGALRLLLSG